jgi:hypothetical protein
MSAVLKLSNNGNTKSIYLIYDFKQVDDTILMVMYVDKIAAWKKFFINYENGSWNTKGLSSYTDATTLESINDKLKFISHELDNANEQPNVNLEQVMQENAEFILNVCT